MVLFLVLLAHGSIPQSVEKGYQAVSYPINNNGHTMVRSVEYSVKYGGIRLLTLSSGT